MEELTKQQIVLVTLLVSFVTSIATGIVTVALMDQAPPGVTQTINRVVERTIEKVTPAQNQAAAVVTKETVVVKEDDLVVAAVDQNTQSLVSIVATQGTGDSAKDVFVGNGLVVSKDGNIVTDSTVLSAPLDENQNPIPQTFKAILADGTVLPLAQAASTSASAPLTLFKPKLDASAKAPVLTPATLSNDNSLKLGQTVIAMGGDKISVATGIVSNLSVLANSDSAASSTPNGVSKTIQVIKTDTDTVGKFPGSILVNLSGDVVGIHAGSVVSSDSAFLSANAIFQALAASTK